MGREIQKRKNRSSRPKIRQRRESKAALRNPRGNAIIAANWDNKATISQNYRRLGLAAKLNSRTGGVEKTSGRVSEPTESLLLNSKQSVYGMTDVVQVEKDPTTGAITRILSGANKKPNPLGDPLRELDSESDHEWSLNPPAKEHGNGIIEQLEEEAAFAAPKRLRQQSQREVEWIEKLVNHYGYDYSRMARDRKLNPMQQTETDLRRRILIWKDRRQQ